MSNLSVGARLAVFGLALVATFALAYTVGAVFIPESFVEGWGVSPTHG